MKKVDVNVNAPVVADTQVFVSAPIDIVWGVFSDFQSWPDWNKGVKAMELHGDLKPGTTFVWVANGSTIRSRLEEVKRPERIVWSGRSFGIRAIHVWEFEEKDGGTCVSTRESFEGLLARLLRRSLSRMLAEAVEKGALSLKAEAEVCHDLLTT